MKLRYILLLGAVGALTLGVVAGTRSEHREQMIAAALPLTPVATDIANSMDAHPDQWISDGSYLRHRGPDIDVYFCDANCASVRIGSRLADGFRDSHGYNTPTSSEILLMQARERWAEWRARVDGADDLAVADGLQ